MLLPTGKMKKHGEIKIKEQREMPSAPQKLSDIIILKVDGLKCKDRKLMMRKVLKNKASFVLL